MKLSTPIIIALSAACLLALASCGSKKQIAQTTPPAQQRLSQRQMQASEPAERIPAQDFDAMTAAYTPWTDLSVPVKVSVTKPKKITLSGTLAMRRGEAISLALRMFFIEVGTLYADADEVLIVSQPAGIYYQESLERFTAASGLSLADLQALLLGQAFAPGKGTAAPTDASAFKIAKSDELTDNELYAFTATPRSLPAGVDWHFTAIAPLVDLSVIPQVFAISITAGSNALDCTYAGAEASPAGPIASMMQITGQVKKHSIDAIISATAAKAKWNGSAKVSRPTIPSSCRKVTTDQIFKALKSL